MTPGLRGMAAVLSLLVVVAGCQGTAPATSSFSPPAESPAAADSPTAADSPAVSPAATTSEPVVVPEYGVEASVVALASSLGKNPKRLHGYGDDGSEVPLPGITVEVPPADARIIVRSLQNRVAPGYMAFILEQRFGIGGRDDVVAVMRARDMFEVVRTVGTNGWNYGIGPEEVAQKLEGWHEAYGLVLVGAGFDWFEAEFVRQPTDMRSFANEVYKFCPDVVEQGTGTVEALAAEMQRENTLFLWWD